MLLFILALSSCERIRDLISSLQRPLVHSSRPYWQVIFGAPNGPVRALRYYHRYMIKHPENKEGQTPNVDSN